MRLSKTILFLVILTSANTLVFGQYENIPKDYFQFPIQPNKVNFLSGTMGELRATHFHAGLDIKTNGQEGLKVYAAANGYVSRIRVATGGYGNSIYIKHPNGTTTVYAHLQRFDKDLAAYVLKKQYENESFEVNLFPQRDEFKVAKGEVIGLSGNSGSSSGPHLHFEIRNSKQEVLDPLRIGFDQIKDQIPPIPLRIALKTMDIDSRVNGQFGRFEFELLKKGNEFLIPDTISAYGNIGVEIWAHDKLDGASNRNGVPMVRMYQNRKKIFDQDIDLVNFSEQKNILIHTNYNAQKTTRRRYNKLYVDDGNNLNFYDKTKDRGFVQIQEDSINNIAIFLEDDYENQRRISFVLSGEAVQDLISTNIKHIKHYKIQDNTLMLSRPAEDAGLENITIYSQEQSRVISPSYSSSNQHIYLWDLRKALPDSIVYDQRAMGLQFKAMIPSNRAHSYLDETYSLKFNKGSLFDTLYLQSEHSIQDSLEVLQINDDTTPLRRGFTAELQPKLAYDSIEQMRVYKVNKSGQLSYVGGKWADGVISFSVSSLGKFTLSKDEKPPEIRSLKRNNGTLRFRISDKESGIKELRAEINGKWLLMNYDRKRNLIWSERLDKTDVLKGNFNLKVVDNSGNESTLNLKL